MLVWRMPASPRAGSASRRGLTLIEVLIALCLLGITTTLVGSALARSVSAVRDSRLDLLAATLCGVAGAVVIDEPAISPPSRCDVSDVLTLR